MLRGPQHSLQMVEVHPPDRRKGDLDHGGDTLPPCDLIRVMLVGANEDHRLTLLLQVLESLPPGCAHEVLQLPVNGPPRRGRQRNAEDLLQLVDGARRARATGNDSPHADQR